MHGKVRPSLPIPTMSTHCLAHCETSMVGAGGLAVTTEKLILRLTGFTLSLAVTADFIIDLWQLRLL